MRIGPQLWKQDSSTPGYEGIPHLNYGDQHVDYGDLH